MAASKKSNEFEERFEKFHKKKKDKKRNFDDRRGRRERIKDKHKFFEKEDF